MKIPGSGQLADPHSRAVHSRNTGCRGWPAPAPRTRSDVPQHEQPRRRRARGSSRKEPECRLPEWRGTARPVAICARIQLIRRRQASSWKRRETRQRRLTDVTTVPGGDQDHLVELPPQRLVVLQRSVLADQSEPGPVFHSRHAVTAATVRPRSLCRISAAAPRFIRGRASSSGRQAVRSSTPSRSLRCRPTFTSSTRRRQQANQATLVTPPGNTPNILAAVTGAQYAGAVQSDDAHARHGDQRRGQPASREPHAVSRAELHHRPAGHLPVAELGEERTASWVSRLLVRSACSAATSRRQAGHSATGRSMPISENDALFTLIGTTYGGDGQETFGLPDLQSRIPIHAGQGPGISQNYQLGEKAGVESVTLTVAADPNPHPRVRRQHRRRHADVAQPIRSSRRAASEPSTPRTRRPRTWRRRPSARSAAASRTTTFSRISASRSSFRCSASSRPQT